MGDSLMLKIVYLLEKMKNKCMNELLKSEIINL
jgi:hypothetical protein